MTSPVFGLIAGLLVGLAEACSDKKLENLGVNVYVSTRFNWIPRKIKTNPVAIIEVRRMLFPIEDCSNDYLRSDLNSFSNLTHD